MESNENKKKTMILAIVAVSCLLIAVIGATYAYFQVLATNNVTGTNTQGQTDTMPKGTLVTNITALKINLDADLMSKEKVKRLLVKEKDSIIGVLSISDILNYKCDNKILNTYKSIFGINDQVRERLSQIDDIRN